MTAAELRLALKAAEKAERDEQDARRMSVLPRFTFTFLASPDAMKWERVMPDCGVAIYCLHGELANKAAMDAVGGNTERLGGSMNYYVNLATPTPRIIGSTGGGRVWIKSDSFGCNAEEKLQAKGMVAALEAFLTQNPEGGDVTELMTYWGAQPVRTDSGWRF